MTPRVSLFLLSSLLAVLPAIVLASSSSSADEWFQELDMNHDGALSKSEYDTALDKLTAFFHQPLQASSTASSSSSPFFLSSFLPDVLNLEGFWKAFTSGVAMILATEIGDKTFFIAAVLSMKHDRSAVFLGAILALIIMTILSSAMGLVLPRFLPRQYTHYLGGALFLYFGFRLCYDSSKMQAGRASDELEEVEEELLQQSNKKADEEEGSSSSSNSLSRQGSRASSSQHNKRWYQVVLQALTLTFLAEWGDRSQIATIALAAHMNPVGVTVGGCLGHSICTGLAVVGGRMLAARISEKTVSLWGGAIFIVFGLHSVFLEE